MLSRGRQGCDALAILRAPSPGPASGAQRRVEGGEFTLLRRELRLLLPLGRRDHRHGVGHAAVFAVRGHVVETVRVGVARGVEPLDRLSLAKLRRGEQPIRRRGASCFTVRGDVGCENVQLVRRRHDFLRVRRGEAVEDFTFVRLAGYNHRVTTAIARGTLRLVEAQFGLAALSVPPMAGEAVFRKNRPDVAVEVDLLHRRAANCRGGEQQRGREANKERPEHRGEKGIVARPGGTGGGGAASISRHT